MNGYLEILKPARDCDSNGGKDYKCLAKPQSGFPEGLEVIWHKAVLTCAAPVERAFAFLWHDGANLHAAAVMEDSDVRSDARGRNDQTWLKGDVMELFFRPACAKNYFELHLTPSLSTLELAIPSPDTWRGLKREDMHFDSGFVCEAKAFTNTNGIKGWWGHMKVPLGSIGASAGTLNGASFAVCRYNYNATWGADPELSATTAFKERNFHQPELWHRVKA